MKLSGGIAILTAVLLAGCASAPKQDGAFRQLKGATPEAAFAADLPVESAGEAIAHGDEELAKGKDDHAIYYYVRALDFDAGNPETFYKIGMIHLAKGDAKRAEWAFRLALQRKADHAGAEEELGLILLRRRDYAGAKAALEGAVTHGSGRWPAEDGLGALADLQGEFEAAARHYQAAVAINPGSAQLESNFGYSRYLAGDWDGAEAHYRRAIQNDPKFRQAWQNLGLLQVRRGELEEASETFGQILSRAEAENNVGYLCMIGGDYRKAEAWFRRAVKDSASYYPMAERNLVQVQRLKANEEKGPAAPVKTAGP